METTTQEARTMIASQFTYDVYSDATAHEFFALLLHAGVQQERIDAMRETRRQFLAS